MKFIIEFQLKPENRNAVMDSFEQRGPNRNPGVAFRGGWIGTKSAVAYVLVESDQESLVASAAASWADPSQYTITPVIDIEQF